MPKTPFAAIRIEDYRTLVRLASRITPADTETADLVNAVFRTEMLSLASTVNEEVKEGRLTITVGNIHVI